MGVWRPADVVVLAAGRSSRMGEPKGLVLVGGRPWIEHQLSALEGALCGGRIVLVLGHGRERYLRTLPDLSERVVLVVNPEPERGPFSSLQVGLAAATPGRPVFVLPVDVPAAAPEVWAGLLEALRQGAGGGSGAGAGAQAGVAVPLFEGRGGHPVLLSPSFTSHLRALPASARLDEAIRALPEAARRVVPTPDRRVRLNLNEPEDWGKVQGGG